jgi:hypothetical protein
MISMSNLKLSLNYQNIIVHKWVCVNQLIEKNKKILREYTQNRYA